MSQTPSRQQWVTVRVTGAELLKRVQADLEAKHGVRLTYGQCVTMLARRYLDEKAK